MFMHPCMPTSAVCACLSTPVPSFASFAREATRHRFLSLCLLKAEKAIHSSSSHSQVWKKLGDRQSWVATGLLGLVEKKTINDPDLLSNQDLT
jgi:hypothetical protein